MTSSKKPENATIAQKKQEIVKKVDPVKKPAEPVKKELVMPSEPDLSEDDISALMTEAIEEKKQAKFAKMIDRGSAIAA